MIELTDVLKQIFTFIHLTILDLGASQLVLVVKTLPTMQDTWVHPLGWEDPLE